MDWPKVKKKICSTGLPSVKSLTNAELRVLLWNVPALKSWPDTTKDDIDEIFAESDIEGDNFDDLNDHSFVGEALEKQLNLVVEHARKFIPKLKL